MAPEQPSFGERIGAAQPRDIQLTTMDERLINALWNVILTAFPNNEGGLDGFIRRVWSKNLGQRLDSMRLHHSDRLNQLRESFYALAWYRVYEVIEELS